jgi:hypothetical protein
MSNLTRSSELSDKDIYAPFPDGNGTFPMHLRREFLMNDGTGIMLLTTDLDMVTLRV